MWLEVLAAVVAVVVVVLGYSKYKRAYWSSRGVPCVPKSLPIIGHLPNFMKKSSWLYMDKLYREQGGDKVLGLYFFHKPRLCVGDPELVKAVLVKDFDHFVDRPSIGVDFGDEDYFNELLTNIKGDHWKGVRSVLSPSFTSGLLKTMFPLVEEKADHLVTYIKQHVENGRSIYLKETLSLYTLEVISSCAFGVETSALTDGDSIFKQKVDALSTNSSWRLAKILLAMMMPWVCKKLNISLSTPEIKFFREVVEETIKKREQGQKRGDFLDIMMEAREDQKNASAKTPKYKLENKTVVANSFLFIIAGFDTTSTTLSFATFLLARYKHYQDRLREEMRGIIRENGTLTYQEVMEAKLLDAVIQETLRIYPPAHATERQCTKEYRMAEHEVTITPEVTVVVPIWSLHHDPRYWEAPGTFMPERFLPENKDKIVSGAFLPFGLGPRNCIGMRFALMKAKLALAKLLLNFQISCVPGEEELQLDTTPGLMKPAKTTRLVFTPLE
ncbi:cytochrome P450 3A31-like [Portunus trituberculatus]|uniref:cytochrome P450 3A31-like n=1 Tax=Portunus trituberculatus TaxID=210409 RepID=UPI001E1CEC0D|nr:cytochrome P450 3A31-like [Portunus trituberculatus]